MTEDRSLLDYAYVVLKWRRMILVSAVSVALAAAIVSLLLPKQWTARTTLLPPEEESDQLHLSSLVSGAVPPNLARLVGGAGSSQRLLAMLASRRVLGALVDSFGLMSEYDAETRDLAIAELDENVARELSEDGTLSIEVTASTPDLAAALGNALTGELDAVNRHYRTLQARSLRMFLEQRCSVVEGELAEAGAQLRRFQEQHRLVDLQEQTGALVETIKQIARELALAQVELGVSERLMSPEQDKLQRDLLQTEQLRLQVDRLVDGQADDAGGRAAGRDLGLGPALMQLPALGQQYARLQLELEIRRAALGFLRAQLEEARYREAKDTPTILVLDPATPPTIRSAPHRTLIVLAATAISLVFGVLLAFALESAGRIAAHEQARLRAIRQVLRKKGGGA